MRNKTKETQNFYANKKYFKSLNWEKSDFEPRENHIKWERIIKYEIKDKIKVFNKYEIREKKN